MKYRYFIPIITFVCLLSCKKDEIGNYSNGLATFKDKSTEKYGFIDKNGKMVIPTIYDYATSFKNGYASVKTNSKWGIIDTLGKIIIPIRYEDVRPFEGNKNYFIFTSNGKSGILNKNNIEIIPPQYNFTCKYYKNGYFEMNRNQNNNEEPNLVLYDTIGKMHASGYSKIINFYNNFYAKIMYKLQNEGYMNNEDFMFKIIDLKNDDNKLNKIKSIYDIKCLNPDNNIYNQFIFQIKKNIVVNYKGDTILPINIYNEYRDFSDNIFVAKYGNKYGFINRDGKLIIKPIFDSADKVENGIAQVSLNNKNFFIDMKGNCVKDCPDEMWAEYYYKLGFSINSEDNQILENKIEQHINNYNFNEAIELSKDAIRQNPSYYKFYYLAAISCYKNVVLNKSHSTQLYDSENFVNQCLELNPNMLDAYFLKGNIYNERSQYDEALKLYEIVINKKAEFPDVYIRAANIYNKKGNKLKACECLNVACNLGAYYVCEGLNNFCY